jgi:putative acetyltransferase
MTIVNVQQETPRQDVVATLLRQSDALAAALYPGEYRRALYPETLAAPGIQVFVARTPAGAAAGCCALFDQGDGTGELKRMIVDASFRNQGVESALLRAVEDAAQAMGLQVIQMEVGVRNTDGQALYRRGGYQLRGPFGTYKPSPISLFFKKSLILAAEA